MSIQILRGLLDEIDGTYEGLNLEIRLSLAGIVLPRLKDLGWTQRDLSERSGVPEPTISKIAHGDTNWQTDTAAKLLHALGVKAKLVEERPFKLWSAVFDLSTAATQTTATTEPTHGQSIVQKTTSSQVNYRSSQATEAGRIRLGGSIRHQRRTAHQLLR